MKRGMVIFFVNTYLPFHNCKIPPNSNIVKLPIPGQDWKKISNFSVCQKYNVECNTHANVIVIFKAVCSYFGTNKNMAAPWDPTLSVCVPCICVSLYKYVFYILTAWLS